MNNAVVGSKSSVTAGGAALLSLSTAAGPRSTAQSGYAGASPVQQLGGRQARTAGKQGGCSFCD